jgi:hypothetical protein
MALLPAEELPCRMFVQGLERRRAAELVLHCRLAQAGEEERLVRLFAARR